MPIDEMVTRRHMRKIKLSFFRIRYSYSNVRGTDAKYSLVVPVSRISYLTTNEGTISVAIHHHQQHGDWSSRQRTCIGSRQ